MKKLFLLIILSYTFFACASSSKPLEYQQNASSPKSVTPVQKQMGVFAFLANINYNVFLHTKNSKAANDYLHARLDSINNYFANENIKKIIGNDWKVVWRSSNNGKKMRHDSIGYITHNAMFVAKGKLLGEDKESFVVGIAGTNILSNKEWFLEDFNIITTSEWQNIYTKTALPEKPKISQGTRLGFQNLMALKDVKTNETLFQFFEELNDKSVSVYFSGHSLGGTLAPVLGLSFEEWINAKKFPFKSHVYTYAGATPGDKNFSDYFEKLLGANFHSLVNSNNLVPHAWQPEDYLKIQDIYINNPTMNTDYPMPKLMVSAYKLMIPFTKKFNYYRLQREKEVVFTGKDYAKKDETPIPNFAKQAGFQHARAYMLSENALNFKAETYKTIRNCIAGGVKTL